MGFGGIHELRFLLFGLASVLATVTVLLASPASGRHTADDAAPPRATAAALQQAAHPALATSAADAPTGSDPTSEATSKSAAPTDAQPPSQQQAQEQSQVGSETTVVADRRPAASEPACQRNLLVRITRSLPIRAGQGRGPTIGTMPATSKYLGAPITAWVIRTSGNDRYGLVTVPWSGTDRAGWIDLRGLSRQYSRITVRASLRRHETVVERNCRPIMRFPVATGAAVSPSPRGRFFVTDRVPTGTGFNQGSFGHFAFGISGRQPKLPPGWTGGDQMAIHGTNSLRSIGTAASAGCLRAEANVLEQLKPHLLPGTPVIIEA